MEIAQGSDSAEWPKRWMQNRFALVREATEQLVAPLEIEDYVIQAMKDVCPPKWHLAHTTWFFESFVLKRYAPGYRPFHRDYEALFRSCSALVSRTDQLPPLFARPTVKEIKRYRAYVNKHIMQLLEEANDGLIEWIKPFMELGIHHEERHQERLLADIKYNFSVDPMRPVYQPRKESGPHALPYLTWHKFEEGPAEIGYEGMQFCFDNETPRHKVWMNAYRLASQPVTNGEYLQFIEDGGYSQARFWLDEGWEWVRKEKWEAPLYWEKKDGKWCYFTLSGMREIDLNEPVCHVSYYEAAAYARWAGKRLPTEAEWELAFANQETKGNFADSRLYHPAPCCSTHGELLQQGYGDVWEWTMSPHMPYPGNKGTHGEMGTFNAKYTSNRMVLRGGSCITPEGHVRPSYRHYLHPHKRWQFSGIRLADDLD
ncbi:ergothioneine biosynthesis protein EgtB [Paenibacillus senegalensis]|uniref:ergothioneine biosynthesis protein EgtB n=1 Tax=Paenibacillus senegalensis TaxID=1465766 RepID=UPI000289F05E|nr:ergothioneine biosynthesis protein EgtB [Paenibacillus senegalensis]